MLLRSNFVSEPRTGIVAAAIIIAFVALAFSTASQAADLKVSFADAAWDGKKVPKGQQCSKFGGNGATPALNVEKHPGWRQCDHRWNSTTEAISRFPTMGATARSAIGSRKARPVAMLPSVPGEAKDLPEGSFVENRNRATGDYARPGYLPPCSGGSGNKYFAEGEGGTEGRRQEKAGGTRQSEDPARQVLGGYPRQDCRASTTPTHMESASAVRRAAPPGSCFRDDFLHAGKAHGAAIDVGHRYLSPIAA